MTVMTHRPLSSVAAELQIHSEYNKAAMMFSGIALGNQSDRRSCMVVMVTHVLPDKIALLEALQREFGGVVIIPKPHSIHRKTFDLLETAGLPFSSLTKQDLRERRAESLETLKNHVGDERFIVLDIGGYFASMALTMKAHFKDQMVGIVEDTENGHQKYVAALPEKPDFPLVSSARSPLKEPEDALIGLSIVFSAEAELRTRNIILLNKTALVLGYGKIGRGIAESLRRRDVDVYVCDINYERCVQARSHGFKITDDIQAILPIIDLPFSATGNQALGGEEFDRMKDEAYVVSATSADDEMQHRDLQRGGYVRTAINDGATVRYTKEGKSLYLIADGEAANFLHGGSVGPYIYLIQGEIFCAALAVASRRHPHGISEVTSRQRQIVAKSWRHAFNDSRT
jgi:adenosylhomocysteinase